MLAWPRAFENVRRELPGAGKDSPVYRIGGVRTMGYRKQGTEKTAQEKRSRGVYTEATTYCQNVLILLRIENEL
jgi:hypothetical protein